MEYFNLILLFKNLAILVNVVVTMFVILLSFIGITLALLQKVTQGSTDLYQYKVKNFYLSYLYATIYILGFIFFLYGLRVYNVNYSIDLKELYQNCCFIYNLFRDISLVLRIYITLLCLLVLCIFLLLIIRIHKFFIHHIFNLYLYYTANFDLLYNNNRLLYRIDLTLGFIGSTDLITHLLQNYILNLLNKLKIVSKYHPLKLLSKILFNTWFKRIIIISPLIFIFYDCIFNNWILTNVFYYLLLYIPLILFKRITTCVGTNAGYIASLLWNIYYEKDKIFTQFEGNPKRPYLYALSNDNKKILDIYLLTGLRFNLNLSFDTSMYINAITLYVLNYPERNTYMNDEGTCLTLVDNRVYIENEIEIGDTILYTLGEEYILLANKTEYG